MERQTLTIGEASAVLGIGRTLGYTLAAKNEFPCRIIRAGKRLVVPRVEVERLLGLVNEQRNAPSASPEEAHP